MRILDSLRYQEVVKSFEDLSKDAMSKPNIFIMPFDPTNEKESVQFDKLISLLKKDFQVEVVEIPQSDRDTFVSKESQDNFPLRCIAIDSGKPEKIKDILKKALWSTSIEANNTPFIYELLSGNEITSYKSFHLSDHGAFFPCKRNAFGEIRTHSFIHKPVFYRYRVVVEKVGHLPTKMKSYLESLFEDCPNHLFQKSEFRASARSRDDFRFQVKLKHIQEHELIDLAEKSKSFNQFRSRHENLQKYLLLNDPHTIACEVPLWLEPKEIKDYKEFFNSEDILTGHIDVLRHESDGKIGIWDYKPRAATDKNASIQVFLYALMLAVRTGISFKNFLCGFFDETDAFSVELYPETQY
jgi:hypothetical protein